MPSFSQITVYPLSSSCPVQQTHNKSNMFVLHLHIHDDRREASLRTIIEQSFNDKPDCQLPSAAADKLRMSADAARGR